MQSEHRARSRPTRRRARRAALAGISASALAGSFLAVTAGPAAAATCTATGSGAMVGDTKVHGRVTVQYRPTPTAAIQTLSAGRTTVQILDDQVSSNDVVLKTVVTDANGNYEACFFNSGDELLGRDVYIKIWADNTLWRVNKRTTSAATLVRDGLASVVNNVSTGSATTVNHVVPEGITDSRGWQVHAWANRTNVNNPARSSAGCWDNDGTCAKVTINWDAGNLTGSNNMESRTSIRLRGDAKAVSVGHELGHFVQHELYNSTGVTNPCGAGHSIFTTTTEACAFSEGWAEAFGGWTQGTPLYFTIPDDGVEVSLENPLRKVSSGTFDDLPTGPGAEIRVAATFWDLFDTVADSKPPTQDVFNPTNPANGPLRVVNSLRTSRPTTMRAFFTSFPKLTGEGGASGTFTLTFRHNTLLF